MDVRDFFPSLCLILATWEKNYSNCLYYGWKPESSYPSGLESGTLITQAHLDFF